MQRVNPCLGSFFRAPRSCTSSFFLLASSFSAARTAARCNSTITTTAEGKGNKNMEEGEEDRNDYVKEYSIHANRILNAVGSNEVGTGAMTTTTRESNSPHVGKNEKEGGVGVSAAPLVSSTLQEFSVAPPSPHNLREEIFKKDFQYTSRMRAPGGTRGGQPEEEWRQGNKKEDVLLRMWREVPHDPSSSTAITSSSSSSSSSACFSHTGQDKGKEEGTSSSSISSSPSAPVPPHPTGAPPAGVDTFQDRRPTDPNESTEVKRRRLEFQSQYRGMVEMDLICGHFARCKLSNLSREMLMEYDILLKQLDNDLFKWLVMREAPPADIAKMPCFLALKNFVEEEKKELLGYY